MKSIVKLLKQKRSEDANKPVNLSVKKPPNPSKGWRKRLHIQGSGEIGADMAVTTPKSEFVFPEDHDFSRTVQSSNPLSSRVPTKEHDSIESFVSYIIAENDTSQDVNISDILKVKDFEDDLGLMTISRELTPRSDNSAEASVIRGLKSMNTSTEYPIRVPTSSEFEGTDVFELDRVAISSKLHTFEHSKDHKTSGLSDYSGVLNSGSTQSDFNSRA